MSEFVVPSAPAAAEGAIQSRERITLAAPDWNAFRDALVNPPEPNDELKRAARLYRKRDK